MVTGNSWCKDESEERGVVSANVNKHDLDESAEVPALSISHSDHSWFYRDCMAFIFRTPSTFLVIVIIFFSHIGWMQELTYVSFRIKNVMS